MPFSWWDLEKMWFLLESSTDSCTHVPQQSVWRSLEDILGWAAPLCLSDRPPACRHWATRWESVDWDSSLTPVGEEKRAVKEETWKTGLPVTKLSYIKAAQWCTNVTIISLYTVWKSLRTAWTALNIMWSFKQHRGADRIFKLAQGGQSSQHFLSILSQPHSFLGLVHLYCISESRQFGTINTIL